MMGAADGSDGFNIPSELRPGRQSPQVASVIQRLPDSAFPDGGAGSLGTLSLGER